MLINELEKAIKAVVTDKHEDPEADIESALKMAQIGGGQKGFTEWLIECIEKKGRDGWWYPHTLFRTYRLRGKDRDTKESNRIRAEIRAATEACPFIGRKAWNKKDSQKIFKDWLTKHNDIVEMALKLNEGDFESSTMTSCSSNYLPTKEDCETAIRQLYDENVQARTEQVLDRIEKNVTSKGMTLKSNWRMITEENMKIWSN